MPSKLHNSVFFPKMWLHDTYSFIKINFRTTNLSVFSFWVLLQIISMSFHFLFRMFLWLSASSFRFLLGLLLLLSALSFHFLSRFQFHLASGSLHDPLPKLLFIKACLSSSFPFLCWTLMSSQEKKYLTEYTPISSKLKCIWIYENKIKLPLNSKSRKLSDSF